VQARAQAGTEAARAAKIRAQDRLARTTQAVNDMRALQAAARAAAGANSIPNGLASGGLKVLTGANAKWEGANAPAASGDNVNITQTAAQALLHWETFNVGSQTTLHFDQSAGGADSGKWIAFNKVFDPSGKPSQIRGQIKADGQVYIINQNGILFGAGSQVNARTLVASSLPINDNLVERGLLNQESGNVQFHFSALPTGAFNPPAPLVQGDVVVERGASISSPLTAEGYGGRVMLVGPNVTNSGDIFTPAGQTLLAAGLQVGIDAHSTADPSLRGLDVYVGTVSDPSIASGGEAINAGLIEAGRGSILMAGKHVRQLGVLESTTSVDVNGRIDLLANYGAVGNPAYDPSNPDIGLPFLSQATGFVEIGPNALMQILPEWSRLKTLAASSLPMRSKIQIQGRTVHFSKGSMLLAPSAEVNIDAGTWVFEPSVTTPRSTFVHSTGQIYLDEDSLIDVSGSTDLFTPLDHQIMTLQLRGAELADSPLQRSAGLRAVELMLDMRSSGSFYGREWVGTPLGDVTGYLNLIERTVGQLTMEGGDINLCAGGSVVLRKGAILDASGGFTRNEGGKIQTTRVRLGRNLIDIDEATPDRIYEGIYDGKSTRSSAKWGVTKTFANALAPLGAYTQREYLSGANAGTLSISAPSMALDGDMQAARIIGPRQLRASTVSSNLPDAGRLELRFEAQDADPARTANKFGLVSPTPPTITFQLAPNAGGVSEFSMAADDSTPALFAARLAGVSLSPELLDDDRFGEVLIRNGDGDIHFSNGTPVAVPADGELDMTGANILIDSNILAPSGTIHFAAYTFSPYRAKFLSASAGDVLPAPDFSRGTIRLAEGAAISTAGGIYDNRPTVSLGSTQPMAIAGGAITLEGFAVELAKGSRVDVSGGIAYAANGKYRYGDAGSLSLLAGQDPNLTGILGGRLQTDAQLAGYSGGQGGSLAIKAPLVQVGSSSSRKEAFVVQPEFFNEGGFAQFELIGIGADDGGTTVPGVLVAPGTLVEPRVTSAVAVPFGSGGGPEVRPVQKPVGERDPVGLTFRALGAKDNLSSVPIVRGDLVFGEGAEIRTDPGAEVRLIGQTVTVLGKIGAPGGSILIEGAAAFPELVAGPVALPTVYLGPSAHLSAAGTTVLLPDSYGRRRGFVQPGGTIEISGNIIAEAGSVIDVSGAADFLDLTPAEIGLVDTPDVPKSSGVNAPLSSLQVVRTRVESNGGSLFLNGSQMLLSDATLLGHAGGTTAVGGFLSVSSGRYVPPGTPSTTADINLLVKQEGRFLGGGSRGVGMPVFDSSGNPLVGMGAFAVDPFSSGGFAALELGGNVRFDGPVSISAPMAILLGSGGVVEANAQTALSAPYIRVGQPFPDPLAPDEKAALFRAFDNNGNELPNYNPAPTSGTGSISLAANLIDVGTLVFNKIGRAEFSAPGGDIRGSGVFVMAGDLLLRAGQIYPPTAANFDVFAYDNTVTGAPGRVSVQGAAPRPLPMSAGGSLRLMASLIEQGGTLRAPFGRITLGWDGIVEEPTNDVVGDAAGALATPVTQRLSLSAGSVTSVSAIDPLTGLGAIIPYGMSPDGLQWIAPTGLDITLAGLPEKVVSFGALNMDMAAGSVVDIRGGGDLYAYRWVQGLGGFEDILANENSFAVVPGYAFNYAPYAPFNRGAEELLGDRGYQNSSLEVGDTITLRGSEALPAGTYTLLPARYALLPGGVLVTPFDTLEVSSGDPFARYQSSTPGTIGLEDGSSLVAGRLSNSLVSGRGASATATTFKVLSSEAFRAQSQYEDYYANDFLRQAAADHEQTSQRLPADSGKAQFFSAAGLVLDGALLAEAASGGRGGFVDIAVPGAISITGGGAAPAPGSVELKASLLSAWGVESLLVGGSRSGGLLDVRATSITLDNPLAALTGPEIILAARQNLTLAANAQFVSSGELTQSADDLSITGDGALLRATGDASATVSRTEFVNSPLVGLTIGAGTRISGAGITLDSTYNTNLASTAVLDGENVYLHSGRISILLDNPAPAAPAFGLVLAGPALQSLAGAGSLTLLSYSSLDVYGTGSIPLGNPALLTLSTGALRGFNQAGGTVTIQAGELLLDNSPGALVPADEQATGGTLLLDLGTLRVGKNRVDVRQFSDFVVNAPGGLFLDGEGGLSTSGNFRGAVSSITAASASRQTLLAGGDFALLAAVGAPNYKSGLGATISVSGRTVTLNPSIVLPSGRLEATSSAGALNIGGNVDLAGRALTIFDMESFTDGGSLALSATGGDVTLGGFVNVSAASGGANAGAVAISVPDGSLHLNGSLQGIPGIGGNAGSFSLETLSLSAPGEFDLLNAMLDGGSFFESRSFRARTGDVTLSASATAKDFRLFADSGAITVSGRIDSQGAIGGNVHLASHRDLTIAPGAVISVEADDFDNAGKGGKVTLEAGTQRDGVAGLGEVVIAGGSKIDLSVLTNDAAGPGTSPFKGQFQGTLHIRAPQKAGGTDLEVAAINGLIEDASSILVEGFQVTDLTNPGGSEITAAVRSAIQTNGNTFGSNIGDLSTPGSITQRLLASNAGIASTLVVVPGAEIVNRTGSLSLLTDWNLATYRFGPKAAPGVLTLRAAGDTIFQGALSDGFNGGTSLWASPLLANNAFLPMNAQTWSYRITAGSDTQSADALAIVGTGSIKLGKDYGAAAMAGGASAYTPDYVASRYQAIRTGSGGISLAAATDIQLLNQFAVIYTAGTRLASENSIYAPGDFEIPHLVPDAGPANVADSYVLGKQQQATTAQYSVAGGDISLIAGNDIARLTRNTSGLIDDSSRQTPANWLYRRSYVDESGEYGRTGVKFTTSGSRYVNDPDASTTWWIDFTNFFEGVGTLGGGNIRIFAGQDIRNIDAVAPTTARAPRGSADGSLILEMGGGDVRIEAGRDISGGLYYVERGGGVLSAGRDVTTNQSRSLSLGILGNLNNPNEVGVPFSAKQHYILEESTFLPTTLFVGRGGFDISAMGDVLVGPTANPFLLPQGIGNKFWYKTYFNTYGESSYLNVSSVGGDITFRTEVTLPGNPSPAPILGLWMEKQNLWNTGSSGAASNVQPWLRLSESSLSPFSNTVFGLMVPNLSASALTGAIRLVGDLTLFPAATGGLKLVAAQSLSGFEPTGFKTYDATVGVWTDRIWAASILNVSDTNPLGIPSMVAPFAYFSTLPRDLTSLPQRDLPLAQTAAKTDGSFLDFLNVAFTESGAYSGADALSPTKQARHAAGLLHAGDSEPVRVYASDGNISGLTLFSPKAAQITAGNDITDIAFYIQNVSDHDVSFVSAGRDIEPNNPNTPNRQAAAAPGNLLALTQAALPGDLQISGPGSFQVLAGRDLDLGTGVKGSVGEVGQGITSIGNTRNPYLPFADASLYVGAGIGPSSGLARSALKGDAFLEEYLKTYESELGEDGGAVDADAMTPAQRAQLALRVLALVLRDTGRLAAETGDYETGIVALDTLFGEASGRGDINTRNRDIRTRSGGEIHLFAPRGALTLAESTTGRITERPKIGNFSGTGGLMLVSNTEEDKAPEGIVTEYGGSIGIVTDGDVSIGQGRIFTLRGGNIVIWSSTGDIAAGAASKTVSAAPPTRVLIDPISATVETDLSGLATGGGIGVLSTVEGVEPGDVDLIAPVGTVDAGDAGIRATGNLNIAAISVLNADNISTGGTAAGVPSTPTVAAPNVSGLTSGSSSATAASSAANSVSNQATQPPQEMVELPSLITVEVIGYGGGENDVKKSEKEEEKGDHPKEDTSHVTI
jgi:filamentous hemagglutinin family protein